ncbi:hypothetical protein H6G20_21035 [Desertifilum sp. FACHB-1129]|uniref:Uncharacterized protein n=2 Tax=Desertifilum tharense IPPAS B-1220 TaxID=1781255 RepID=A0A1E5QKL9_9CYAN|nr:MULTISPECIES: hypothetical protein [Desertifilum]MDA0211106.1 hypothetical protein [Cyanobacteria bacterium FC1]MDI9636047.1 hypothetical protein [Geitlerinema splendidum]MBD2314158.1 hypothetical protein [Desertifilum sp. FACHB-1129]MBD2320123.1 hypothetical protein [Desertifilum sp. FACHB-866]MBD2330251.1 hypothetical protein [Desertifilum sp. FACHB-868]
MLHLCPLVQGLQFGEFLQGDCVQYVGSDLRIQQDYGNQELRILAIDRSGMTVCEDKAGNRLVGVSSHHLKHL